MFSYVRLSDDAIEQAADYFAVKPVEAELLLESIRAPRQDSLILLSEQLVAASKRLVQDSKLLSERNRPIQQRSIEITKTWNKRRWFKE